MNTTTTTAQKFDLEVVLENYASNSETIVDTSFSKEGKEKFICQAIVSLLNKHHEPVIGGFFLLNFRCFKNMPIVEAVSKVKVFCVKTEKGLRCDFYKNSNECLKSIEIDREDVRIIVSEKLKEHAAYLAAKEKRNAKYKKSK